MRSTRANFITAAAAFAGAGFLSACSDNAVGPTLQGAGSSYSYDLPKTYEEMRRAGIVAFEESRRFVVLPEYKMLFDSTGNQIPGAKQEDCTVAPQGTLQRQSCLGDTGSPAPSAAPPVITTVHNIPYGSCTITGQGGYPFDSISGLWIPTGAIPPATQGPKYTGPNLLACTAKGVGAGGTLIGSIVAWFRANPSAISSFSSQFKIVWSWYLAGELTLAEFAADILALLTAPEMLAVLAAVGATAAELSSLYQFVACLTGN